MKKVVLFSFLFLLIACAREPSRGEVAASIATTEESQVFSEVSEEKPNKIGKVKVYIENTLSMYGYLPEKRVVNTDFRNAVNELLIASKGSYGNGNVELSLINNATSVNVNIDNNLDNIDVKSLTKNYSQGRGSSDFDKLFKDLLQDWEDEELLVFIADFIYSPDAGTEVTSGLDRLRQNITDAFQKAKGAEQLAVNILHLGSDFYGKYYDIDENVHLGIDNRPYYIFIIGNENNVRRYSENIVPRVKKYDLRNKYFLTPSSIQIKQYSALPFTLNTGHFLAKRNPMANAHIKEVIVKSSLNKSPQVQLAVTADLGDIPVSEEYLMDINNYDLNDNRIILREVGVIQNKKVKLSDGTEEAIKSNDLRFAENATHCFLLSFPNTYKGTIELSLKKNTPQWVSDVSIKDGQNDKDIKTNTLKQSQTFGFNSIVKGINDAQRLKNPKNEYFRLTLDIDQEKTGSGIGAIIGWLIGLVIIGIIIFIVIRNKQRK